VDSDREELREHSLAGLSQSQRLADPQFRHRLLKSLISELRASRDTQLGKQGTVHEGYRVEIDCCQDEHRRL
jgi:hypothetical protein